MTAQATGFRLGPFMLDEFIAQGGMGRVWRAYTSKARNDLVAVKVLRPDASNRHLAARAFRREVQSVARLRHPGIVPIYDFGVVSEADATRSVDRIEAGSPYLVMELVEGPSLGEISGDLTAEAFRRIIVETLEALSHSHARSIIHRDLKPSNILLAPRADGTQPGRARLTDFGIAHALDGLDNAGSPRLAEGTPGFMAPEQNVGLWRDFGPWTDLYSVGRMVEEFLVRTGSSGERLRRSLGPWLERMCAPAWSARYELAADAIVALLECAFDGDDVLHPATPAASLNAPTVTTMVETSPGLPIAVDMARGLGVARAVTEPPPMHEVAEDWRRLVPSQVEPALPPWGLGLYGLRPNTLIAREGERDALWDAFGRAADDKQAQIVLVRGATGVGKSCLARWLCQLAHESGAGQVLSATFGERPDPSHGIGPMLARHFRTSGLDRAKILARIEPALRDIGLVEPTDWMVLTELIADDEGEGAQFRFGSERERNRALLRFFARCARRRPLVIHLDDPQRSRAALAVITELQRSIAAGDDSGAIVVVATINDDATRADSVIADEVAVIAAGPHTETIDVPALDAIEHKRLVRRLLALEDSLAARVEELSDGNPLFAEQLLGDLIVRGVLEPGDGGRFRLKRGAELDMPAGLRELWGERIAAVIDSEEDSIALELAAALGAEVRDAEWTSVCSAAGIELDPSLLERLFAQRLAEPVGPAGPEARWRFVHSMLAETLEETARENGRLVSAHELCAALLTDQDGAASRERVGRHLLAAGAIERAESLLLAAAVSRHGRGEFRDSHFLLAEREAALRSADVPESDPRRLEGWLILARCCRTEGELDEARVWASRATQVSQKHGLERIWCESLLVIASVARLRGETDTAHEAVTRARQLADRVKDDQLIASCFCELAWVRQGSGDIEGARPFFQKCLKLLEGFHDAVSESRRGSCLNGLAHGALQRADTDGAMAWLEEALDLHVRFGSPTHRAYTLGALGDAARADGRLDAAEAYHQQAYQLLAAVGYGHIAYLLMNLGLVELDRRRFKKARTWFSEALDKQRNQGDDPSAALPHAMITPCCAADGDWADFDHHLAEAHRRLEAGRLADIDVAEPLRLAGELAALAGHPERARAAFELAAIIFREIGREDRVIEVTAQIAATRASANDPA